MWISLISTSLRVSHHVFPALVPLERTPYTHLFHTESTLYLEHGSNMVKLLLEGVTGEKVCFHLLA